MLLLDAKSKKCFFIVNGDEESGIYLWDDQNRKITRSRNVIFNEKVLYKDRFNVETDVADSDSSPQEPEFVRLERLHEVAVQSKSQEPPQSESTTSVPPTPHESIVHARRSTRTVRSPTTAHILSKLWRIITRWKLKSFGS
ncbi:hypothetical protein OIU79_001219 [Salix purpurea]|uniref:Retroviral polymerase SH3-like domain-containing protein n=1 Tax=Salix purpurea TaxID=77065 RepID=A0A9Q0ZNN5_SALPP|nr:hypothetical protein OIU79_001219 [Salix purpurea]